LSLYNRMYSFAQIILVMIQRLQSIFLFIAALSMGLILFFPIWQKSSLEPSERAILTAFHLKYESNDVDAGQGEVLFEKNTIYIGLFALISTAISIFSIFQYKNRLFQIKLGALNSLVMAITMGIVIYFIFKAEPLLAQEYQGSYLFGFYLIVSGMMSNLVSNRFIRRDEKLVKSMDRIR
jgi:hypothetical protein